MWCRGNVHGRPAAFGRLGHTARMIVGLLLVGVAAALSAWMMVRLATANPRSQVPIFWRSPHRHFVRLDRPSGTRPLTGVIMFSAILGIDLLMKHGGFRWGLPAFLLVSGAIAVPLVLHNRRLTRTD